MLQLANQALCLLVTLARVSANRYNQGVKAKTIHWASNAPHAAMNLSMIQQLLSSEGQAALAAAAEMEPTAPTWLRCGERLRRRFPAELARVALETVLLRQRAQAKFTRADQMYFTREALEQATSESVARYRARRYAPFAQVADLCCGIGGDTLGLAGVASVTAVDNDPVRLAMARANVAAYEGPYPVIFRQEDVSRLSAWNVPAYFFDPDRRTGGRRHVSIRDYQPPLDAVLARLPNEAALGVKLAPAVAWNELQTYAAEVEFISLHGELKEGVLWFGPLRTTTHRATVLPGPYTLTATEPVPPRPPCSPRMYLYDPDPAITRAGLVRNLAELLDAEPLDATTALLTAETWHDTPFARSYVMEEAIPFQRQRLSSYLRARHVGQVTIIKRGSAVDADTLMRQLKLSGPERRTLILTRVRGKPYGLIARDV
ncbi:MAG: class I SAM-dependent methyltransferase [Gemmataceae bacterium]